MAAGQNAGGRSPQVRSNTSGRTSIAMSHRTPSARPAMRSNSEIIASCNSGFA